MILYTVHSKNSARPGRKSCTKLLMEILPGRRTLMKNSLSPWNKKSPNCSVEESRGHVPRDPEYSRKFSNIGKFNFVFNLVFMGLANHRIQTHC